MPRTWDRSRFAPWLLRELVQLNEKLTSRLCRRTFRMSDVFFAFAPSFCYASSFLTHARHTKLQERYRPHSARHGSSLDEEFFKELRVLKRFKNRPFEPLRNVNILFSSIIETR